MAYEQRDMSGVLFPNDRKQSENQPDHQGDATVDGVKYRVSAWIKKAKTGKTYLSLAFTVPQAKREDPPPTAEESNDNIPF